MFILFLLACGGSLPTTDEVLAMTQQERTSFFTKEAVELSGLAAQSPVTHVETVHTNFSAHRMLIHAHTKDGRSWCVESTPRHVWFEECDEETVRRRADILENFR